MLPPYILHQTGFYNQIAKEYYEETAKAHIKEDFEQALDHMCQKWRRELTDQNVMMYYLESGEMEPDEIKTIQQWYIDHAEPFQKAMIDADLQPGGKYTIFYLNDFGFPVTRKITFHGMWPCQYAQYTDAIKIEFREFRKRSDIVTTLYNCSVAIYEGWKELNREDVQKKVSDQNGVEVWQSKYGCFDARFFEDGLTALGKPLLVWKNFKTRETDGKVFA